MKRYYWNYIFNIRYYFNVNKQFKDNFYILNPMKDILIKISSLLQNNNHNITNSTKLTSIIYSNNINNC